MRQKAEKYDRKFYIQYDVSGWTNFGTELIEDLDTQLTQKLNIFSSPSYAKQNGKLVICVWGFGYTDRPNNITASLSIINQLKSKGFYVIGGVPHTWRTLEEPSYPNYMSVYEAFDMISPWNVGTYGYVAGAKDYGQNREAQDVAYLKSNNKDFQPVIFPGFAWLNWNGGNRNLFPRLADEFLWRQFVNLRELGIRNCFVAMFDEFDEGTAIAKAAEDASMIPNDQYFLTLDADGTRLSSDFYLRVTRDAGRMMKGWTPLVETVPTGYLGD